MPPQLEARTNTHEFPIPPGFRELSPVHDVTLSMIQEIQGGKEVPDASPWGTLFTFDLLGTYKEFWKSQRIDLQEVPTQAIAQGFDTVGASKRVARSTPFGNGLQASPQYDPRIRGTDARAARNGDFTLKGCGRQLLKPTPEGHMDEKQFGHPLLASDGTPVNGWESLGGLTERTALKEVRQGYAFAQLYRDIFGTYPKIRPPIKVLDITDALRYEGTLHGNNTHFQLEYYQPRTTRASYCYYISRMDELFSGFDLSNIEGQHTAVQLLNDILDDIPREHDKQQQLVPLTLDEVLGSNEDHASIFDLILAYQQLLSGKHTDDLSASADNEETDYDQRSDAEKLALQDELSFCPEDKEALAQARIAIIEKGYFIARQFYIKNKELIDTTLHGEISDLAKQAGCAAALGIDFDQAMESKDTLGGMTCDIGVMEIEPPLVIDYYESDGFPVCHYDFLSGYTVGSTLSNALPSVLYFTGMYGLTEEEQRQYVEYFLDEAATAFGTTFSRFEKLQITHNYTEIIKEYWGSRQL